jgi:hypothetical protein
MQCGRCSREISDHATFCGYCGNVVENSERQMQQFCTNCGIAIAGDASFCGHCGASCGHCGTSVVLTNDLPILTVKRRRSKKRNIKGMLMTAFLAIILGIGGFAGYYVARNGWSVVPLADQLLFIPFVKIEAPPVEIYEAEPHIEANDDDKATSASTQTPSEKQTTTPSAVTVPVTATPATS